MKDLAIVQLVSFGDIVISTCLVRALKRQTDCRLTYYVASVCQGAIQHNPDVDRLVVIPASKDQAWAIFQATVDQARRDHQQVIAPWPGFLPRQDWRLLDGSGRFNFMYSYARAAQLAGLTVETPLRLHLHLTAAEKENATKFVASLPRTPSTKFVLAEMQGESCQTHCGPQWLKQIAEMVLARYRGDAHILISAGGPPPVPMLDIINHYRGRVHYLNWMSIREAAFLIKSCQVFLGVSSGTSNACHGWGQPSGVAWFETVSDAVWDSSPLGTTNKTFHYGGDLSAYLSLLEAKLPR